MKLKIGKLYRPKIENFIIPKGEGESLEEYKSLSKENVLLSVKKRRSWTTIFVFIDQDSNKVWLSEDECECYLEEVKEKQ